MYNEKITYYHFAILAMPVVENMIYDVYHSCLHVQLVELWVERGAGKLENHRDKSGKCQIIDKKVKTIDSSMNTIHNSDS